MKTMTQIVRLLKQAQQKCLERVKEIHNNYNMGFISINDYLRQLNEVTLEYLSVFCDDDDITQGDHDDAITIVNFMDVNGLELKPEE